MGIARSEVILLLFLMLFCGIAQVFPVRLTPSSRSRLRLRPSPGRSAARAGGGAWQRSSKAPPWVLNNVWNKSTSTSLFGFLFESSKKQPHGAVEIAPSLTQTISWVCVCVCTLKWGPPLGDFPSGFPLTVNRVGELSAWHTSGVHMLSCFLLCVPWISQGCLPKNQNQYTNT